MKLINLSNFLSLDGKYSGSSDDASGIFHEISKK